MTLRMAYQTTPPAGAVTQVSLSALGVCKVRLSVGYSQPAQLQWEMIDSQFNRPIPAESFVIFWDDEENDPNGNPFSVDNPIFEGFVTFPRPGSSPNRILYEAYDPTRRSGRDVTVMSAPWRNGDIAGGVIPTPGVGAIPRLVFNAKIDNDDDYALARNVVWSGNNDLSVGEMVRVILDDQFSPLYWVNAVAGDGSTEVTTTTATGSTATGSTATGTTSTASTSTASTTTTGTAEPPADVTNQGYLGSDLAAMTYKPQEKFVFESTSVRDALDRLLRDEPEFRLLWRPGDRLWRFVNVASSPTHTITLNEFDGTDDVLSFQLDPSTDGIYTAVHFYGPDAAVTEYFSTAGGEAATLLPLGDPIILEVYTDLEGEHQALAYNTWQIVDPDKRRGARVLPAEEIVQVNPLNWLRIQSPILQASWNDGVTWETANNAQFDFLNGIVTTGETYIYKGPDDPPTFSNQNYFPPDIVRIVYAPFVDTIQVRYPTSGYSGTGYTVAGIKSVWTQYDEALAVNYERLSPVTTANRLAQFQSLATKMLNERSNIVWAGACVLDGLNYAYLWLNKRINFAANDANGGAISVPTSSINAFLTDVEYDYEEQVTTLTLNSDQLEMMGKDVDRLKEELKIRALVPIDTVRVDYVKRRRTSLFGDQYEEIVGTNKTTERGYFDPITGEQG